MTHLTREQRMLLSHEAARHRLAADNERLREALRTIEAIASATDSANSMRHIAKLARAALVSAEVENPTLRPLGAVELPSSY